MLSSLTNRTMATSLPRLLFTLANSKPHLTRSEPLTRSISNSVARLLYSCSTQQHRENAVSEQGHAPRESLQDESKRSREQEEKDDEDGDYANKETGEVGGPKGPEPTRYGDWERNGGCYDF